MSSRGSRAASKRDTASKFAELRALKATGRKRIDTYKQADEDDIYEEVDEDGYKKVVRDRLDQDDFVVDDNGLGYVDNGMDDWQHDSEGMSDDDERSQARQHKSSSKSKVKKNIEAPQVDKISKYLSKDPIISAPIKKVDSHVDIRHPS